MSDFGSIPILSTKSSTAKDFPVSLDWRTRGVIAPVRDQGLSGEIETAIVSTGKYFESQGK
jgi:hypothetical protein